MKIKTIPQLYRNLNRAVEIFAILGKYGLAGWMSKLDVDFAKDLFKNQQGEALARHSAARRFRFALTELGPTFIKFGQVLSTRPDLVGVELATELELLLEEAPADPPEVVRETIQKELGQPVEELFDEFDDHALASASIGQVHRARLPSGEDVVVKVQHRHIEKKMRIDLDILAGIAQLAERVTDLKNYRPTATVAEFRRVLLHELDFAREQRNMERFRREFNGNPAVRIPRSFPDFCTGRVLTMERLSGVRLVDRQGLQESQIDLDEVAKSGADLFLEMIFTNGFYHADPHPGNFVLLEGGVIGLLDYGMVGLIDEPLRERMEEMLFALVGGDAPLLTSVITRVGATPPDLDRSALSLDLSDFVAHYADSPLAEFDLTAAVNELTEIIRRHQIMLPARIAMLLKVLVMLEGTSRLANPKFSLMELLKPYKTRMILRRLSPARQWRKLRRLYHELEHLAEVLPRGMIDIMQQVQTGKFDVHLDHRGLEPSVNRLALGLLASAVFIGSAMMLCTAVPPLILGESLFGLMGCTLSLMMGMRLWWAMRHSGYTHKKE
jgi:ubiquinone biosynthesis protein